MGADPDKGLECLDGITGMICDGGNQGCTMKGVVAVDAAWQSVGMAMQDVFIYNVHGINGATPEETMRNMGRIASPGMVGTEPIAIAYEAAKAREVLGCEPDLVKIGVSSNIIKNVKSVVVPNTDGMRETDKEIVKIMMQKQ